jgi:hypothetical protein
MGVIYKLKEEVVHFIISQRQSNPLASCRQLAESASQKFGLNLSKSSVNDVLKESGITTPRGRKPKNKFEIPQEKKNQIQASLSQVKLIPPLLEDKQFSKEIATLPVVARNDTKKLYDDEGKEDVQISPEHERAGSIFYKAALWDLGIFSEENIKATDWNYYLTYSKGIKVVLENNKSFFIDLPLPLERCIREAADGLINNVKPLIVDKVSDEGLFKACMEAQEGFKIGSIAIVDGEDHILLELSNIVESKRRFMLQRRVFVESSEKNPKERLKAIFFPQLIDNNGVIDNMLNLKGFDTTNKYENVVTLLINNSYENKIILQAAAEKLNGMYLRDGQDRLVNVKIEAIPLL